MLCCRQFSWAKCNGNTSFRFNILSNYWVCLAQCIGRLMLYLIVQFAWFYSQSTSTTHEKMGHNVELMSSHVLCMQTISLAELFLVAGCHAMLYDRESCFWLHFALGNNFCPFCCITHLLHPGACTQGFMSFECSDLDNLPSALQRSSGFSSTFHN